MHTPGFEARQAAAVGANPQIVFAVLKYEAHPPQPVVAVPMSDDTILPHHPLTRLIHIRQVSLITIARWRGQWMEPVFAELEHMSIEGRYEQVAIGPLGKVRA